MKVFSSLRRSGKMKQQKPAASEVLTPACSSIDPDSMHHETTVVSPSISLGIGQVSKHGITFTPRFGFQCFEEEITATASEQSDESCALEESGAAVFRMRAADLSVNGEPWVTLEASGSVVDSLYEHSERVVFHEEMWNPDSKTAKMMASAEDSWKHRTFCPQKLRDCRNDAMDDHDILVWSGSFENCYGSEIPAIRSASVIAMDAWALAELLIDSSRVKSYNALSLGRTDNIVWNNDTTNGIVTKIMTSETRVLRKTLTFTSLLHVRKTNDGDYHLVTRAAEREEANADGSEILLGINRIVPLSRDSCLMINVNHIKSPLVPMMIAKRIGLQAAVNFVHDIRKVC